MPELLPSEPSAKWALPAATFPAPGRRFSLDHLPDLPDPEQSTAWENFLITQIERAAEIGKNSGLPSQSFFTLM